MCECDCPLRAQSLSILGRLLDKDVFERLLDPQFDKCYGASEEYKYRTDDRVRPAACARFGVRVEPRRALARNVFSWVKVYHGTKKEFVSSIVRLGYLLKCGDESEDGQEIGSRDVEKIACADGTFKHRVKLREGRAIVADAEMEFVPKRFVFSTPSFAYASDETYAQSFRLDGNLSGKVILEFRLRPDSYQRGPQTILKTVKDLKIIDDEFEFFTPRHGVMVLTGIIVKPKAPQACTCQRWPLTVPWAPSAMPQLKLECATAQRRWSVLQQLGINPFFFDHSHDRCYCGCTAMPDEVKEAGRRYVLPKPGTRFALALDEDRADLLGFFTSWHTCFHGTTVDAVASVIECGYLLYPGCITMAGQEIRCRGHNADQSRTESGAPADTVCVSPSVRYAAHPVYARPFRRAGAWHRVAFQLKARPGTYRKFPSTVRGLPADFDPLVPVEEMEWHTRRHGALVLYAVVVLDADQPLPADGGG